MRGRNLYLLLLLTTLHTFLMGHQTASHDFALPYNDMAMRDEDSIVDVPWSYKGGTFPSATIEDSVGGKEERRGISDMELLRFPRYDSYRQRYPSSYIPRHGNMWQRSAEYEDYDPVFSEGIRRLRRNKLEPGSLRGLDRWRLNESPLVVRRDNGDVDNEDRFKLHQALNSPFTMYGAEPPGDFPIDEEKQSEYEDENIDHVHPKMMDRLTKLEAFDDLAGFQGGHIQNPSRTFMMRRSIPLQISNSLIDGLDVHGSRENGWRVLHKRCRDDDAPSLADQYRDAFGALPSVGLNGEIPRAKRVKRMRLRLRRPIRSINRNYIRVR